MITELFKICGLSKKQILERLENLPDLDINIEVNEKFLDGTIILTSDLEKSIFDTQKTKIYTAFEQDIYSVGDMSLQVLAAKLLKLNNRVLAVAESITGGEICSMLTEIPGISNNFYEGIVCYNKTSKNLRLGVLKETLSKYGAVSKETALEMIKGLDKAPVDICLATTGLAGPDGDEGKPVGLVYIAVGTGDFVPVFERMFTGSRNEIRHAVSNVALFYLIRYLKGNILLL